MEKQDKSRQPELKDSSVFIEKKCPQEQISSQKNIQDIDQEQNVNATPFQFNTQNFNVENKIDTRDYCGKITGVTYLEKDNRIIPDVNILLYFGNICEVAVYKTKSDENGNFLIEDLPPGYYSILAYKGNYLRDIVQFIKVLVAQNVHQSIQLRHSLERIIEDIDIE